MAVLDLAAVRGARRASRRGAPAWAVVMVAAVLLGVSAARAEESAPPVETDRPDVSNGTRTVPPGAIQVEAGVASARTTLATSAAARRLSMELTLRAGITERLEARLDGEPVVRLRGAVDATDRGDLRLGLKYRFLDSPGGALPSVGVLPFVKLPVAETPIGSERPDVGALALASFELPWQLGLDLNGGVVALGQVQPAGFRLQAVVAATLARDLAEGLSTFVELFYASPPERDGRDTLGAGVGLVYRLTRTVAIDAGIQTSLAGPLPDYALRAGLTIRFGR